MASNNRRLIYNTRERLLSTDLNDATALLHAKSTDELVALITGDRFRGPNAGSGVLAGGIVGANGADLNITVSPLLALKLGNAATSFDSPYLKIETDATTTIDLSPFVDPGNPRWVAIEVAPGDAQEVVSSRDIFQPALGTFIPQNVDKVRRPEPVFTVNAGTPAAQPVLPLGNPDVIPLAYVYIDASAAQIEVLDVILCRPVYRALNEAEAWLQGRGGIDVDEQVGPSFVIVPRNTTYRPPFSPVQSIIAHPGFNAQVVGDPNFVAGQSFPAAGVDERFFVYLATAPYPGGYDNDIQGREYVDASGRIPSNPLGAGFPFLTNGILVFTTTNSPNPIGAKGAPFTAITAINDPTWNGGTIDSIAYLGTVTYNDNDQTFKPQRGSDQDDGWIYYREGSGAGQVGGILGDTQAGSSSGLIQLNGRASDFFNAGGGLAIPQHVREIKARFTHSVFGAGGLGTVVLQETAFNDADFGVFYRNQLDADSPVGLHQEIHPIFLDDTGFFEFEHSAAVGVTSQINFAVRGYLDSILALR